MTETFQPGDLVQFKPSEDFRPRHTFAVLVGSYMTVGDWLPMITTRPFTSEEFVKVGTL